MLPSVFLWQFYFTHFTWISKKFDTKWLLNFTFILYNKRVS